MSIDCVKVFSRSEHLRSHTLSHGGRKPFKCEVCRLCFSKHFSYSFI